MNRKYIIILILSILILYPLVQTQAQATIKTVTVEAVVTDESGNPVQGAQIFGNEGTVRTVTDATGRFSVVIEDNSDLLVECKGYVSGIFASNDYQSGKLALKISEPLFGKNDEINLAFRRLPVGVSAQAVSTADVMDILKYDNVGSVSSLIAGRTTGMFGGSNLRGLGSPEYVIDGLPRDPSLLNAEEIESITILKDVNSAILYGNFPLNGVILITTKRGSPVKREMNVRGHYGVMQPRALPKYLSSADYMEQYNIAYRNDGLGDAFYSEETINNYRSGNPYRYPNVDYYSSDYVKSAVPYSRVMLDLSGGNRVATYYSDFSWENQDNLLNFGYGKESKLNSFNVRGNLDLNVTDRIKTSVDATGFLYNNTNPIGEYWSRAATYRPDRFVPLIPIDMIDPEISLLKASRNHIEGKYLAGGNTSNQTNPITDVYLGGKGSSIWRNFSFTNRIDVDLDQAVKGLSFHTNISFDYLNAYYQYVQNNYATYQATWDTGEEKVIVLQKFGEDNRSGVQNVGSAYGQRRFGFYAMFAYDRTFDTHRFSVNLLGFGTQIKRSSDIQPAKNTNLGLRLAYSYDDRYIADFSSAVVHSVKLHPNRRNAFSPSLALAWVVSSEDFMADVSFVDYLKLKVSGGVMNTDDGVSDYYLFDDRYALSGGFYWYDGNRSRSGTVPSFGPNADLRFEKRKDVNVGLESFLFDKSLTLEATWFTNIRSDIVTRVQTLYPGWFANYTPYDNYNSNGYRGFELGLSWQRQWTDWSLMLGGNMLWNTSERIKVSEVYANDYQYREGKPLDARFGLVSEGFFTDQSDIDGHAYQMFGAVQPGDIKYADLNNDGYVDANDETEIGRWQAPFYFSFRLKLSYRRLTLFAMASGQTGATGNLGDAAYNNYYWIQGDGKYSEFMLNHWTEANKNTATYPRLSTRANNNNFRSSSFWLFNSNYFNLDRVQVTYNVPIKTGNLFAMKTLSVFASASGFLTLGPNIDVRILNIGTTPQYRSFSIGLKTLF